MDEIYLRLTSHYMQGDVELISDIVEFVPQKTKDNKFVSQVQGAIDEAFEGLLKGTFTRLQIERVQK